MLYYCIGVLQYYGFTVLLYLRVTELLGRPGDTEIRNTHQVRSLRI